MQIYTLMPDTGGGSSSACLVLAPPIGYQGISKANVVAAKRRKVLMSMHLRQIGMSVAKSKGRCNAASTGDTAVAVNLRFTSSRMVKIPSIMKTTLTNDLDFLTSFVIRQQVPVARRVRRSGGSTVLTFDTLSDVAQRFMHDDSQRGQKLSP